MPGLVVFRRLAVLGLSFVTQIATFLRLTGSPGTCRVRSFLFDEPCTFLIFHANVLKREVGTIFVYG